MTGSRIKLAFSPALHSWQIEADAMGIGLPMLIGADLARLRRMLADAAPDLSPWEWGLVAHIMDDEGMALIADVQAGEAIISGDRLAAGILEWADAASLDLNDVLRAERLAARARAWNDIERWALMVRRRTHE